MIAQPAALAAASLGRLAVAGGLAFLLSACSMGNLMGGGGGNASSQQFANSSASETELASVNALPAIATECPEIKVRPGAEAIFNYGGGQVGNARELHYQAVIDNQSRNCVVSNGLISVKMGVVGRVLLGPKGDDNQVNVPLRFAVERDNVALFSERYDIPVTIAPPAQSGEFVKVIENVQIPYLGGEVITIWVGFDPA